MKQRALQVFHQYFEVCTADTQEVREAALALRYQVYCLETGYEDKNRFPDGFETDEYDWHASHSVVFYRPEGSPAATVRLVLPHPTDASKAFPIEENCKDALAKSGFDTKALPRETVAEISRFAVSKSFKRRMGEAGTVAGISDQTIADDVRRSADARLFPHLTIGLFRAIVRMSAENNITHWYAVMEPSLLRLLTRFGIAFQPIAEITDYHGLRQPCIGVIDDVLAGIWRKRLDVWGLITDEGRTWPAPKDAAHANVVTSG